MRIVAVKDTTTGKTVGSKIAMAETSLSRLFGLLGKRKLDAGCGLWIRPSSGVHTFFMMFRIDVIGLDKNLKVIKLWRCLAPFRVTSVSFKMHSVVELPCGTIKRSETRVGDQLEIARTDITE